MSVQFIENNGQHEYAVIPVADYQILLNKAEMLEDVLAFDAAVAANEESLPTALVQQLVAGKNKLKVWRKYRGMTQKQLAQACHITVDYIEQLETAKQLGTVDVLKSIAAVLNVDIDDLV